MAVGNRKPAPMAQPNKPSPSVQPHIWSSVLRGLQLPLTEHNVDYAALLDECDIPETELQKVHGQVSFKKYLRFIELAAVKADDPLLGIRLARSAGPESLGALGFLFLSSRTLADALTNFCSYLNLLQDTTYVDVKRLGKRVCFSYQLYDVADVDCRQDVEFSLALTCRLIRMFCGVSAEIDTVAFRHSPSVALVEYERLLKTKARFNQESNSIYLPVESTRLRGHMFDASLSGVLKEFLNEELRRKDQIHSFADQVRHVILDSAVTPPVTAQKAADYLGVSKATLYRKLKAEQTTYGALFASISFEIAKSYLADSKLSVTQIAHIIGFAESASFTRAFARWSGGTRPSEYRNGCASGELAR